MARVPNRPNIPIKDDFFKFRPKEYNPKAFRDIGEVLSYMRDENLINKNIIDVRQLLISNNDIILIEEDISPNDGYIVYRNDKFYIYVNSVHHINRKRFTMAHEYMHYLFHRAELMKAGEHKDKIIYRDENIKKQIDMVANRLAAELLMPEANFRNSVKENEGDVVKVAQDFQVSTLAVRYRAKSLGLEGHEL